jgi:predicted nucleotidyltransferase component of viral defense system
MTFDISRHKILLFQILKDIYTNTMIAPFLGFKGGTAALMFYGLDRFSVDLDFDLLDEAKNDAVFESLQNGLKRYGTIKETYKKRDTLFYLLSYEDRARNVKVEVSQRHLGSHYEVRTYLGVSMIVMVLEDLVAHKLMAMYERMGKTSRDVYDVWFFLQHRYPINMEIVEQRAGMSYDQFLERCIEGLKSLNTRQILAGMGELLTPRQKDWVKVHLQEETIALLSLRKEGIGH